MRIKLCLQTSQINLNYVTAVQESAPMENAFSAQRAAQQREWLQELDQQREEAKLRRQREKEINSQVNLASQLVFNVRQRPSS